MNDEVTDNFIEWFKNQRAFSQDASLAVEIFAGVCGVDDALFSYVMDRIKDAYVAGYIQAQKDSR
jgi:hypothetical protein